MSRNLPVVVVGAGPAGLATSAELTRAGVEHVVLERGPALGHTWRNLYDSLTLHTGKHMSVLPGLSFPRAAPLFLPRDTFVDYLDRYAETFRLPIEVGTEVTRVDRIGHAGNAWRVETTRGAIVAGTLVMATGIVANPHIPSFPDREAFRGRVMHSAEYRRAEPFRGRRVLVVGVGNSGGEIGPELAAAGAHVTVAVRSGAATVPRAVLGVPTQYLARGLAHLPRPAQRLMLRAMATVAAVAATSRGRAVLPPPRAPTDCPEIPLIGFHLVDAIRRNVIAVRPAVAHFTETGVAFIDGRSEPFDEVILATGYRAALGALGALALLDSCGFGRRVRRVVSPDYPNLYFIGHNNDTRGAIFNIANDAPRVRSEIARS